MGVFYREIPDKGIPTQKKNGEFSMIRIAFFFKWKKTLFHLHVRLCERCNIHKASLSRFAIPH